MNVMVIDYGMGNLGSVLRSFEECGAEVMVSNDPSDLGRATHVVLPGVGAFADGMAFLHERGWVQAIKQVAAEQVPILGICLGMQLLAEKGYEGGKTKGLGLIPGQVVHLLPKLPNERIPHLGWNEVDVVKDHPIINQIVNGADFYFAHSYYCLPENQKDILLATPYCGKFVSMLYSGTVFGVQFHPEKSSRTGFQLIKNFLAM